MRRQRRMVELVSHPLLQHQHFQATNTRCATTLGRLLHFGPHCRSLRQRVRPKIVQLRKLTGRDWGLEERQLRTVASGYVRGSLEHAAAAWLPATSDSHVAVLEREIRAAARVVTDRPISTPSHALMAEAGLASVADANWR